MGGYAYIGTASYKPNELYVFFGRTHADSDTTPLNIQQNVQLFRPFDDADGDWSSLTTTSIAPNCFLFGASVDRKGYLFGGTSQQGWDNPASGSPSNQAHVFTPYSSYVGLSNPLPDARSHAGCFALFNDVFITGGYTTAVSAETLVYSTIGETYSSSYAAMVAGRYHFACFAGNGFGWAIGGYTGSALLNTVEKFDNSGPSWSVALTGPFSGRDRVRGGCTTGDKGSIFGGKVSGGGFLDEILILDTVGVAISVSARKLLRPVVDMAAAGLLDKVYAVSGQIAGNGTYRDVTQHDPLTDTVATMEKIEDFRRNGALALAI